MSAVSDLYGNAWVVSARSPRNLADATRPYGFFVEEERSASGHLQTCATVLLTNRECPWRCVMCDLWKNTTLQSVAPGVIPAQIAYALGHLQPARTIKLYNSGSFFDRGAIPVVDNPTIALQMQGFDRVIVESHPDLAGVDCLRFRDLLDCRLEVAMGLETAHPDVLRLLNKGITTDKFARAARFLQRNGVDLRVFILVRPPFMEYADSQAWTEHSLNFAFDCGATAVTVIATRGGNGAMELLAQRGEFQPPSLHDLESALEYGIAAGRGRVFADLWDAPVAGECGACVNDRIARLRRMNLEQVVLPRVHCESCAKAR